MRTGLLVEDHRGEHRFRGKLAANFGAALELPDVAAVALLGDADMQAIARNHGSPKPCVIDAHEIDELAFRSRPKRMNDEDRGRLRHRLDDQNSWHDRPRREM